MAYETFQPPVPPSPGTENTPEFKLLEAEFGDGYTQTTRDGMNHIRDVLSLQWDTLTPAQAAYITGFIRRHGGDTAFLYTPSDETTPIKWTCKEISDIRGKGGLREVKCVFRRSFNIAQ